MENIKKPNSDKASQLEKKLKELGKIRKDVAQIKKYIEDRLEKEPEFFKTTYEELMKELPEKDSEEYLISLFEALYVDPIFSELNKYKNQ